MKRLNVKLPDELHARAKGRAAISGRTLQEYVTDALREVVERDEADAETDRKRRR